MIAGAVGQGQSQASSVPRDNSGVCHVLSGLSAVVWEQTALLGLMGALTVSPAWMACPGSSEGQAPCPATIPDKSCWDFPAQGREEWN